MALVDNTSSLQAILAAVNALPSMGGNNAILRVTSEAGALITIGVASYQLSDNETYHDFPLYQGSYTVTSSLDGNSNSVSVTIDAIAYFAIYVSSTR